MLHDVYFRMVETWRPIPGFEDTHLVSDQGRVRRGKSRGGHPVNIILKPYLEHGRYYRVALNRGKNSPKYFYVHRLVAAAFLGPCPKEQEVNHKNGDKKQNHLANLEYTTKSGNMQHAHDIGLFPDGIQHHSSKITEDDVRYLRLLCTEGVAQKGLADRFGISISQVNDIIHRHYWKRVV